jgi:hypothetical protein
MINYVYMAKATVLATCVTLVACGADPAPTPIPDSASRTDVSALEASAAPQAPAAVTNAPETGPDVIDDSAVAVLKKMTSAVAALPEFKLTMETGFDVLQPNGEKLEFGSRRTANIRRPDRARMRYEKRSGEGGELVFDGSNIWAYQREENAYATIAQPGDIDATLDFVTLELGIPVPASDFFAKDPSITLATDVLAARDLGPSTIGEQPARHIALRKPGVNYQIWVSDADALPLRMVITYNEEPGQPQFWVQFLNWDTAPTNPENAFAFKPPEGAERIRFATFDTSMTEIAGGDAP